MRPHSEGRKKKKMNQKLKDRKVLFPAIAILLVALTLTVGISASLNAAVNPTSTFTATGMVTVEQWRDGELIFTESSSNLITNAGKDFISAQLGSTSPGTNGANYIAVTSDTGAPAAP